MIIMNHSFVNFAGLLSKNAFTPSALSLVAMLAMNRLLSWSIAADSPTSSEYFTALLVKAAATYDFFAILAARPSAVSINLSWGTT